MPPPATVSHRIHQMGVGCVAPGGVASSVLDLTGPEPHVLREGAIPTAQLLGQPPPRAG